MIKDSTFVYWAMERDKIRRLREAQTPRSSWTDDIIFQQFRFCNVSREDDRVTRWIKQHIRDPFDAAGDEKQLFMAICLSRFFNLEDSLDVLVVNGLLRPDREINFGAIMDCLMDHKDHGGKCFNGAYMVKSETGVDKITYVCNIIDHADMPKSRSREGFVKELSQNHGFGSFMAGQVAADLAYTSILRGAPDHQTWAPMGPGAVRGMNRALGRHIDMTMREEEYLRIGRLQLNLLPPDLVFDRKLTLHDVASNVNCETDKYLRVKVDGRNPKRRFK